MSIRVKLYRLNFFIFIFLVLNITCYAEVFDVGNMAEFSSALSQAENTPNDKHKIDITGDIILDSPVSEALNLELTGDNSNFTLNGYSFTFTGAGKVSKISNLNIIANTRGSSVFVTNQNLTVENTHFSANAITNSDSLLTNRSGNLTIKNSDFSGNTATNGGAIYLSQGSTDITGTTLSDNRALTYGGAGYTSGGVLTLKDSFVKNNNASMEGGALYINSGTVTIDHTNFDNNYVTLAGRGGAIVNKGNLTISNGSSFTNNHIDSGTGGAIVNTGTLEIDNSLFDNNSCLNDGGAITGVGKLNISNSTFSNNKSTGSIAGAIINDNLVINNCLFENNKSYSFGGAIVTSNASISDSIFRGNESNSQGNIYETSSGGAIVNLYGKVDLKGTNIFEGNIAEQNGGAIFATAESETNITGNASFLNNKAETQLGGAIYTNGTINISADNPASPVVFSGNTDSTGSNAFHLSIDKNGKTPGTMNLNISNGSKVSIADSFSGVSGTKLNINGTSSYTDNVDIGGANTNFAGHMTTNNIQLNFNTTLASLPAAYINSANTNFNLMNGFVNNTVLNNLDLSRGGNSISLDVDPANLTCDYINLTGDPTMDLLTIRDINVLSDPIQSVTTFDLFDHEKYGTNIALTDELANSTVYGGLKTYKWALLPKLTLIELGGLNPNIQRYQGATAAAFMNQLLSYDYSLNRTDEIYTNLRAEKLAAQKLNSYASMGPGGMYVDQHYEDGSAFWLRPYVNLESFHLSGAAGTVNNQSYGMMLGFDFPMIEKNDWKLFPTIYGSYIGSVQQFLDSDMYQDGGYGGFLLSAFKDNFYAGWTINGGGLGVSSKYQSGKDDYAIITAGTALKLAYNWKFHNFILQPNFTTTYTFLSPSNLVNFQSIDLAQNQVNGITLAPSLRLTYRNETGFEPYVYGGCVIPVMSDVKAQANGITLDKMTLNPWAQFGAGIRKHISERVTCFAETVIRTGGRNGWGFMFNIQIAI